MKIFALVTFAAFAAVCAFDRAAFAGGISSGGAELLGPDFGSAWLVGEDRSYQACIKVEAGYPFGETELRSKIETTFAAWDDYIKVKRVFRTADRAVVPSRQIAWKAACDGTETLKFVFGGILSDQDTLTIIMESTSSNAMSFAVRTAYDLATGSGKGVVWVQNTVGSNQFPSIDSPGVFDAILRHEIGHVLGVAHAPGTVMDENIVGNLVNQLQFGIVPIYGFDGIDQTMELVACEWCALHFDGYWLPEGIAALFGYQPSGMLSGSIETDRDSSVALVSSWEGGRRFVIDRHSGWEGWSNGSSNIFKATIKDPSQDCLGCNVQRGVPQEMLVFIGTVTAVDGKIIDVIVERNTSGHIFAVSAIINHHAVQVFEANGQTRAL